MHTGADSLDFALKNRCSWKKNLITIQKSLEVKKQYCIAKLKQQKHSFRKPQPKSSYRQIKTQLKNKKNYIYFNSNTLIQSPQNFLKNKNFLQNPPKFSAKTSKSVQNRRTAKTNPDPTNQTPKWQRQTDTKISKTPEIEKIQIPNEKKNQNELKKESLKLPDHHKQRKKQEHKY